MKTTTPEGSLKSDAPWWERLTEKSEDERTRKSLAKSSVTAALVILIAVVAWRYFAGTQADQLDQNTDSINAGQDLLPGGIPSGFYGSLPISPQLPYSMATMVYAMRATGVDQRRQSLFSAYDDQEKAAEYLGKVESAIADLEDDEAELTDGNSDWLYWNTLQQLHWFAALSCFEPDARKAHLRTQIDLIENKMETAYADHVILGASPDPEHADKNVMGLWKDLATRELSFYEKNSAPLVIAADEGLKAVITLEDGGEIEIEFYSRLAPKSVANFVTHAQAATYNGTAVHGVDAVAGTLTMGGPFSRLAAERKFIWNEADPGYTVISEHSPYLPVGKGAISLERKGAARTVTISSSTPRTTTIKRTSTPSSARSSRGWICSTAGFRPESTTKPGSKTRTSRSIAMASRPSRSREHFNSRVTTVGSPRPRPSKFPRRRQPKRTGRRLASV